MATYTEFQQPEIASDRQHSQEVSISQILDHGSISFGRFAVESLAWEKRSVFQHNRCQEELEMYKSNGLVAQKKAYFEDYYKRIRALKALQAENQETAQLNPCPEQLENENCDGSLEKEKSGNDTVSNSNVSLGSIVVKPGQANQRLLNDCVDNSDKAVRMDESSSISSNGEPEHGTNGASLPLIPLATTRSKASQHDSLVSDPVKNDANKPKKHMLPVLKVKGNAPLACNKSKMECKVPKGSVKSSYESKPRPLHHVTAKRDSNLLPSKGNTGRAASEINSNHVSTHKQLTEVSSGVIVPHPPSRRSRLVPSSPSGRSDQRKANSNGKDLADRSRTNLPVRAGCVQNSSKEKSIGGLKDTAIEKRSCLGVPRKPVDLGNQQMRPKVRQSENQRPKSTFTNNPARNISNQSSVVSHERKSYGQERKLKEGEEESNTARRRYLKSTSSAASNIQKKQVHKNAVSQTRILPRS